MPFKKSHGNFLWILQGKLSTFDEMTKKKLSEIMTDARAGLETQSGHEYG